MAIMVESPIADDIEYRPPTQSQNSNMLAVSIPNFATSRAFVEIATKCLAIAVFVAAEPRQQPAARCPRVSHGLERCEGFRRNQEQSLRWIEVAQRLQYVRPVDIGNEPELNRPVAVVLQRLVRHHRAEIGAADTDVHHIPHPLTGVPAPFAVPHLSGEMRHLVEHGVNLRHDILAADYHRGVPGSTQRRCRTARFSVKLIFSPRNIASM